MDVSEDRILLKKGQDHRKAQARQFRQEGAIARIWKIWNAMMVQGLHQKGVSESFFFFSLPPPPTLAKNPIGAKTPPAL